MPLAVAERPPSVSARARRSPQQQAVPSARALRGTPEVAPASQTLPFVSEPQCLRPFP